MTQPTGRRARTGPTPVNSNIVHIDRPSNRTLHGAVVVGAVLAVFFGATAGSCILFPFSPENEVLYLVGAVTGAVLASIVNVRITLRSGRRRREDFVRCGGDPAGITGMMFGVMRGERTKNGEWFVPEQSSGDYQGS